MKERLVELACSLKKKGGVIAMGGTEIKNLERLMYFVQNHIPVNGEKSFMATLWDGRVITGRYTEREDHKLNLPVCRTPKEFVPEEELRPFVQALMNEGKSFILDTGESDDVMELTFNVR